jgi:hypothetical protein
VGYKWGLNDEFPQEKRLPADERTIFSNALVQSEALTFVFVLVLVLVLVFVFVFVFGTSMAEWTRELAHPRNIFGSHLAAQESHDTEWEPS